MRSSTVHTTEAGGKRGYDAGKDVWGRKHHVIVDTVGNVLDVVVHAADIQDRNGTQLLLNQLWEETQKRIQKIWADGAYAGQLIHWVRESFDAVLDIVERDEDQDGFEVLPRRWVVERTFAWLGRLLFEAGPLVCGILVDHSRVWPPIPKLRIQRSRTYPVWHV